MKAEIILTGNEILHGVIPDKNGRYLAQKLQHLGLELARISIAGDHLHTLRELFSEAQNRSQLIIISGGLGPTEDDLTTEAIAQALSRPLELNSEMLENIRRFFQNRGKEMPPANRKQALFPAGAEPIPNPIGTAPGYSLKNGNSLFIVLPGVPRELQVMFESSVVPKLLREFPTQTQKREEFRWTLFGIGESEISQKLQEIYPLPERIHLSYRFEFPTIFLTLSYPTEGKSAAAQIIENISENLSDFILTTGELRPFQRLLRLLKEKNLTLSAAESCTGGLFSSSVVSEPGASVHFMGAAVTYSNDSKREILGVSPQSLEKFGAVSPQVAKEMAEGARKKFRSQLAVSITGIAGPTGGTPEKPVGTVFFGLATPRQVTAVHRKFSGSRERIQKRSVFTALKLLLEYLEGSEL